MGNVRSGSACSMLYSSHISSSDHTDNVCRPVRTMEIYFISGRYKYSIHHNAALKSRG